MAEFKRVRIMISSRVQSRFRDTETGLDVEIGEARRRLKERLEEETLFDEPLFEVWTSESPQDQSLGMTMKAWEGSLQRVRQADILLVLYTGEAGWAPPNKDMGICHAEFLEAWNKERPKLKAVRIKDPVHKRKGRAEKDRDKKFQSDFETDLVPISPEAASLEEIVKLGALQVRELVAQLVKLGRREARRGAYSHGAPLDWSRMDFAARKNAMEDALGHYFLALQEDASVEGLEHVYINTFGQGDPVLFVCHGIPAAMSVAAAREMVGQPFLRDHLFIDRTESHEETAAGPVHLIACAKSVTEAQAIRQLGFPDATIVKTDFGVYVADSVQKIQMVFLTDCRDEDTTRAAAGAFFTWLQDTREAEEMLHRARGRRKIVQAILDANNT